MKKLKILIVEGNTEKENINFGKAGCAPQSQNFKIQIKKIDPDSDIDIVKTLNDNSVEKIVSSLKKYDGVVLTGSTLRLNEDIKEVKKHIEFAKICFKHEKKIFGACWGLQVTVMAAGGKCRVSPKGPHIGIAHDIELTKEGKGHKLYLNKSNKFTTPAFNYDEVEIPPKDSILLASDKINKFQALHFFVGKSEVWGLQYHPEIPYDYMIRLIKHRSKGMLEKNVFKNQDAINRHIDSIEKSKLELTDEARTTELKNWLSYLKN